jgi:hypothetical protein
LQPARRLDYRQVASLRAAGVSHILRRETTEELGALLARDEAPSGKATGDWICIPRPLPRARLVCNARPGIGNASLASLPLESAVLVDQPVALDGGEPGQASILSDRPGRIELDVVAPGRQLLVLAESFHEGWKATIDGQPAPVLRANADFLGCVVGAGRHAVVFDFQPASLRLGKLASLAGLASLLCMMVVGLLRRNTRLSGA